MLSAVFMETISSERELKREGLTASFMDYQSDQNFSYRRDIAVF